MSCFMLGRMAINRKAYDAVEARNQRLEPEVKVAHTTYLAEKAVREQTVQAAQVVVTARAFATCITRLTKMHACTRM